jgi:hypothetical protein
LPIVLSLFVSGVMLAGLVLTDAPAAEADGRAPRGLATERLALALAAGLLLDYLLVLTGLALPLVLAAVGLLALAGLGRAAWRWRTGAWQPRRPGAAALACGLLAACLLALYALVVLHEPLWRWDARSIWFFHARMIYGEQALRAHAGWAHPSLAFSHPDYPNLVPAVAAQLATLRGLWNEYLPKASLLVMLAPLVPWVCSFRNRPAAMVLLVLFCFVSLDGWLSNGYMDGYLALYTGLALLLFGRFLSHRRDVDLHASICALGIVLGLKAEGLLIVLAFCGALVLVGLPRPRLALAALRQRLAHDRVFLVTLFLALAPALLWAVLKQAWGLQNDLTANPAENLARLSERLSDGRTALALFEFLATRATATWLLLGLLVLAAAALKLARFPVTRGATVAGLTAVLYFAEMYLVYLVTPRDLLWHLNSSAGRTMVGVTVGLLAGAYLLFEREERDPRQVAENNASAGS